jgi:hypothetical protein
MYVNDVHINPDPPRGSRKKTRSGFSLTPFAQTPHLYSACSSACHVHHCDQPHKETPCKHVQTISKRTHHTHPPTTKYTQNYKEIIYIYVHTVVKTLGSSSYVCSTAGASTDGGLWAQSHPRRGGRGWRPTPPDPVVCVYTVRLSYCPRWGGVCHRIGCIGWMGWHGVPTVVGGGCSISGVDGFRRGVLQLVTGCVLSWVADR